MYFDVEDGKSHLRAGLKHSPWLGLVIPRPIGWISTLSAAGVPNLAPFSFFNAISSTPPMVMFCANASHSAGGRKDSFINARDTGEFVHNVATEDLRLAVNKTSSPAPREVDEFELAGRTKAPCGRFKPFRVADLTVSIECRVLTLLEFPADEPADMNTMIIGKVVAIHIRDDLIVDGRVDPRRLRPLARLGYLDYSVVTDTFEMLRPQWPTRS